MGNRGPPGARPGYTTAPTLTRRQAIGSTLSPSPASVAGIGDETINSIADDGSRLVIRKRRMRRATGFIELLGPGARCVLAC